MGDSRRCKAAECVGTRMRTFLPTKNPGEKPGEKDKRGQWMDALAKI